MAEYGRGQEDHQLEYAKHETILRGRGSLAHKIDKIQYCGGAEIPQMRTRNTRAVILENPGGNYQYDSQSTFSLARVRIKYIYILTSSHYISLLIFESSSMCDMLRLLA